MKIETMIDDYRDELNVDFISLCQITSNVKVSLKSDDLRDIMSKSMEIVRGLMERGVYPGNYTLESLKRDGFSFWLGTPDELILRIEDAWIALNSMPDVDDICWFALKPAATT